MDTKKTVLSEDKTIGGSGLLDLIRDTIEKITESLKAFEATPSKEEDDSEDKVEFEKDAQEEEKDKDNSDDVQKDTLPMALPMSTGFEVLNDSDFDDTDPLIETFKNDMGGCGGMVKIIKIKGPESVEKLAMVYNKLQTMRMAHRAQALFDVFNHINATARKEGATHQVLAIQKIDTLLKDATAVERKELSKAREAVLAGTAQHLDAAGHRVRNVFATYAPESMVRTAYTNLETQSGDLVVLPQGKHQVGYPLTLETSKFRDHSVDAKIDPDTGEVTNGYLDFENRRDNMKSVQSRFEIHRNPINDENLMTLAKGERQKPLTKNERTYEQRLDEDTKNRYQEKTWEKSREEALDDASAAQLGHHGDKANEDSIARTLSKTAAKYDKIDPDSDDTFGEQLSAAHGKTPDDKTLEELLEDERVGLTDEELDMLLEEWLESSRTNGD